MNEHFQRQRKLQVAINDETLGIYKELGAEGAYAQIEQALSEAKAEALGAASGTAVLKRLEKSRDKWKEKAKARNGRLQKNSVRIRDLATSRDKWKEKATSLKAANEAYERQLADLQRIKTKREATIVDLELQVKKGRS